MAQTGSRGGIPPIVYIVIVLLIGGGGYYMYSRTATAPAPAAATAPAPVANESPGKTTRAAAAPDDKLSVLTDALDGKDWEAADKATYEFLLQAAGPKSVAHGYTVASEAAAFDCNAIKQVDTLWSKASGNRFGFTTQVAILDVNKNHWGKAYHQMGWAADDKGKPAVTFRYDPTIRRYVYSNPPDWKHLKDGELPTVERNYNNDYSFDATLARCGLR